jgi:hypothetical protein
MIEQKFYKTTCPFCLYGCGLVISELNRGNYFLRKIEYNNSSSINEGRLCARGNMATRIIDDTQRATQPRYNGIKKTWDEALNNIAQELKKFDSQEIAITFDGNNTNEELALIFNFAEKHKIENLAASYLEPELFFRYIISEEIPWASLSDLEKSQVFLILGNIFAKSPMIAKPILDAKYKDRRHKIYYIDSVKTRLAGFANKFLLTEVGAEPLALLTLIAEVYKDSKNERRISFDKNYSTLKKLLPQIYEKLKITPDEIREIARSLLEAEESTILVSLDCGKSDEPLLISTLSQTLAVLLAQKTKILFPAKLRLPHGKVAFGQILEKIQRQEIKALVNFGDFFPYYYPQFYSTFENLSLFVATGSYKNESFNYGWFLPVASILEKAGSYNTLWGKAELSPLAKPISGSKTISEIINFISKPDEKKLKLEPFKILAPEEILEQSFKFAEEFNSTQEFKVMGEESAIGYRGLFEDDKKFLYLSPSAAQAVRVNNYQRVKLITENTEFEFQVVIRDIGNNHTGIISVNTPENRVLFPVNIDKLTKEIIIKPLRCRIEI